VEKVNERDCQYRKGDSGPKYLMRGPRIDWGVFRFLPGQELGAHWHERIEETFYFLRGSGKMVVEGKEERIEVGDVYRIEPGEVHNIINDTDAPVEGVFIKSSYDPEDKIDVS